MKKKDIQNEELDEEIIDDEEELLDDDEVLDDEEIDEDEEIIDDEEEVEEAPKKKAKKNGKKPMKKSTKIAIISSSAAVGVIAIVLVVLFAILPLLGINLFAKAKGGDLADSIDFSVKLTGYQENPNSVTAKTKILNALKYNEEDMAELYNSSLDKNLIAAQMLYAATKNIATAYQYSYFKSQVGTTNIGSKSGTLIVQRMRRQNQEIKDDTTLKLPYNHNFGAIEATVVTGEGKTAIRYVKNNKIYRIISKTIDYDPKTGFLTCDDWKASNDRYGNADTPANSANLTEARFNYISLVKDMKYIDDYGSEQDHADITKPKAVFKKDTAKITDKGDYYEIYVEVDSDVVDNDAETAYMFEKDNTATGVHIAKCNITYQIWKCGLPKAYVIDETWSGKIKVYSGEANAKSECKYSYTDKDCNDDSKTEAIWKAL